NGILFAVGKFLSTVDAAASPISTVFGQPIALSATVSGNAPSAPSGTVTFLDGATPIGSAAVDSSGHAALTVSTLTAGTHAITAEYDGDGNYIAAVSSPFGVTVAKDNSNVGLVSSNASAVFSETVTFTATVTASLTGLPVTSGTVTFLDKGSPFASAPL